MTNWPNWQKVLLPLLPLTIATNLFGLAVGVITPAAAIGADWATIQKRGYLVVGVKDNLPPLGFRNEADQLVGLEIDIAKRLAQELLGDETLVEFVPLANRDRLDALWSDRVDIVIAQITLTNNRARLVDFTLPYYTDGMALVARKGRESDDFNRSARIAVLGGSANITALQYYFPTADLIGVDSYQSGLAALQTNQVDAFAGDRSVLSFWLQSHPEFVAIEQNLAPTSLAIAMPKGLQYQELRHGVYAQIEQWRESGWLRERADHWGLP
ncbi:amino acid ABC transporter substrate-binding protein, PAAT family [Thalassoporum mexicanum PCC 7367]|uniref:transporter substrate-binding domain-containing protein n=1 Tax=Thalassoporum mexicanum TaxID=3457544 RepID=UPI00029FB53E|nr:transporter substrate-binding domain-containing protein [Pseudanabaena sp. PCC 7367]AFY68565.1 amino acid ABC transporter substrate-binding protein, PAAT family [Pseudanabaena sp. PCC 7367]